jgi:ankyrin repeat protein
VPRFPKYPTDLHLTLTLIISPRVTDSDMHLALAVIVAARSLSADPGGLIGAARSGDTAAASAAVAAGADLEAIDPAWGGGWTALNFAAFAGHTDVVRLLVDAGSPVNKRDKDGTTALMWAAQYNHGPATQLLLEVGADVNNQEVHGTIALMLSAKEGHTTTMEPLLAHGVAPNIQSDEGWTALMLPEWRSPGG